MFSANSRYANLGTYAVTLPGGATAVATVLPLPASRPPIGYYRRMGSDRLDLLAYQYLTDATAFWKICESNDAMVPDALAARSLIGIPASQ
jgi:hypothetical protein